MERFKLYFIANDITNAKKVPVVLSLVGVKNYELLCNLLVPMPPNDKSFDVLIKTLKEHYFWAYSIAYRWKILFLHHRVQVASVTEYVAKLRRLNTHCQYGAFLEEAIRDPFL